MTPEQSPPAALIALLASDAGLDTKARACRQLAVTGGAEAVPALAALLDHERLADYARTALEGIPSPAAGEALRLALPKLHGQRLAGAADSLAVRRETAAVGDLLALLKDPDRALTAGALAALGKIATDEAIEGIRANLSGGPAALRLPAAQAALSAAGLLLRGEKRAAAAGLLESLLAAGPPEHLRAAAAKQLEAATRRRLFDGLTLTGWEGDLTWFRVRDGAIVAGSLDKPIPQNEFLCSTRQFGDFELRLKVRLVSGRGNGGIQFRSQRVPNSREMAGYQADLADGYWGGLYDESRRARFLGKQAPPEELAKRVKPGDWNDYVIRCEGPSVRLWLNGLLTTEFTESDAAIPRTGHLGLQIHSGAPSEACYKDLEIKEL